MRFDVLTVFPDLVKGVFQYGVIGKAIESGRIQLKVWDLREFAEGSYRQTDDAPYGGGGGMVMKPEPIARAVEDISQEGPMKPWRILMTPQGRRFDQQAAEELLNRERLLLICGRYEGVDERVRDAFVDDEISIGDYVLSGGEIPAMAVIETLGRLVPGVLGNEDSAENDSFSTGMLDYPHYTRPPEFRGMRVPDVLLSGNHEEISRWRREAALRRTSERRKDLLDGLNLNDEEIRFLESSH
jgi:tRNA (guanine37-N1)-methyltransferase